MMTTVSGKVVIKYEKYLHELDIHSSLLDVSYRSKPSKCFGKPIDFHRIYRFWFFSTHVIVTRNKYVFLALKNKIIIIKGSQITSTYTVLLQLWYMTWLVGHSLTTSDGFWLVGKSKMLVNLWKYLLYSGSLAMEPSSNKSPRKTTTSGDTCCLARW